MNRTLTALFAAALLAAAPAHAIDAPEIIDTYFETIGGREAWNKLTGLRMTGELEQGASKIPMTLVQLQDGRRCMQMTFQGKEMMQQVFDGETFWSTNFMTMKPEKADAEATANYKLDLNDFPSDLLHYKENGYSVEYLGKESFDGAEAHKIKLVNDPLTIDGQKVEDVRYYYFDVDAMILLGSENEIHKGPVKGQMTQVKFSDYEEVDGLYFPFSISQGIKGGHQGSMVVKKIELNPTVDDAVFKMPAVAEASEKSE
jgi:hypothetical protein